MNASPTQVCQDVYNTPISWVLETGHTKSSEIKVS